MPLILNGDGSIGPLSATEIGYLDGVTSAVQSQIDTKSPSSNPLFSGSIIGTLSSLRVEGTGRKIRQYELASTAVKGQVIDLFQNASVYDDIFFYATLKSFHSSRTHAIYWGVFGGYGANFSSINLGSTVLQMSTPSTGIGRLQLRHDAASPGDATFWLGIQILNNSGITVYNGTLYE